MVENKKALKVVQRLIERPIHILIAHISTKSNS